MKAVRSHVIIEQLKKRAQSGFRRNYYSAWDSTVKVWNIQSPETLVMKKIISTYGCSMKVNYTDLLLEAGRLFHKTESAKELIGIIVEYSNSALQPDLTCLYLNQKSNKDLELIIKKGFDTVPKFLLKKSELVSFLQESREIVCLNSRKQSPFVELLLSDNMESGLAVPITLGKKENAVLIVNSKRPFFFRNKEISFLENIKLLARE